MRGLLFFIFLISAVRCFSQRPQGSMVWPLDSPCLVTGNYGELRPNHFHAGIDFSTGGEIQRQVYTVAEGYVSRVRVSPYGYGKCVYVTHPGGKVSVYAHLDRFSLKIDEYLRKQMFAARMNEMDLDVKAWILPVRRSEIVGLSGNTGGSSGPHLHFEIRDEKSEIPVNPLRYFRVKDISAPVISLAAFYDVSDSAAPLLLKLSKVSAKKKDVIILPGSLIGFGFSGYDLAAPRGNHNNIYSATLYLDGRLIMKYRLDSISFDDSRFVNAFSELRGRNRIQKCFSPETYPRGFFNVIVRRGMIDLGDLKTHQLRLRVYDEAGHHAEYNCTVRALNRDKFRGPSGATVAYASKEFSVRNDNWLLRVNARSFYNSTAISFTGNESVVRISPRCDLHRPATISCSIKRFGPHATKLVLKGPQVVIGTVKGDSAHFTVKIIDEYRLLLDTVPPLVTPSPVKKRNGLKSFSFRVEDKLAGIGRYNVFVNGEWSIAEYDPRISLVSYAITEETPPGPLEIRAEIEDKVGNKRIVKVRLD